MNTGKGAIELGIETGKSAVSGGTDIDDSQAESLCVTKLIQRQAMRTPEALAASSGSDRLTYRELDRRSNQLANYLDSAGVVRGSIVGLCLERALDFPVAALGILKAGCAYLPLEPKTPNKRLQTMLNAAQAAAMLTNSALVGSLAGIEKKLIAVDDFAAEISRCSSDPPPVRVGPEELAYVIFTSGSTGAPKGVAVSHSNLMNLCRWHNRAFSVTAVDRATQFASIGFDAAVWELWPHLVAGASVHFIDDETRAHPEELRNWLVREKITISFVPTPIAERMLKLAWPRETALRFLLTGADTLREYPPAGLPFVLVNNYGPTECTVVATSGTLPPHKHGDRLPSIGKPIDNAEVYILDPKMVRVPAGTVGEIYIGGAGVARGYVNDPELTAERFVGNPFNKASDARLYRTGDLGCYLPDGEIAFQGRVDDQVKVRGYRIELNDVAAALNRHAGVRTSVVVARANEAGETQLAAYFVPRSACPSLIELRDFLANELPDYMIPATFISLDKLPIAPSGKVDRSALPPPSEENLVREEIPLNPRSPTERRVAAIVASLLGLEQVGANDNFFYLGGNSLFGTQVIARLGDTFNVEVPLLKLFDHPTVADLAAEVERLIITKLDAMTEEDAQRLLAVNTEQANV